MKHWSLIAALRDPFTAEPVNPNPIFDVEHYARLAGIAFGKHRVNPVHDYLTHGQFHDLSPNRFFGPVYFRARNMAARRPGVTDLERALGRMNSGLAQFHPMIESRRWPRIWAATRAMKRRWQHLARRSIRCWWCAETSLSRRC